MNTKNCVKLSAIIISIMNWLRPFRIILLNRNKSVSVVESQTFRGDIINRRSDIVRKT